MIAFEVTEKDTIEIEVWLEEHDKECPFKERSSQGAAGGRLTYSFTPSGIGLMKKVGCACGEATNVGLDEL